MVVTPTAVGQISATASVTADQPDPNNTNNSETDTTNINPGSAPVISTFTPASGPVGTPVAITGSNFFSSTAVKFNAVNSTFTVNNDGSITATVPSGATTGPIAITNAVGTTTSGSNFTVTPAPDLTIAKTASVTTTPTSSSFDYFVTVSNNGLGAANDVTVSDTLPAGVTYQSISGTGWSCSGTTNITCTMGSLASLATAPVITIIFNAGSEDVEATLLFYSQGGGEPKTATVTIPAGQVRQFDKALSSIFNAANDGGAVHVTTPAAAKLIATARTYNLTGNGTYGQFISAVTPNEAASAETRPLQLLQVEQSDRFPSNIGIVEVTGQPVRLEIAVVPPDAKFTAVTELFLGGNEFRQLGSLLASMGLDDTHNAASPCASSKAKAA